MTLILIAEDDQALSEGMKSALLSAQYETAQAKDGEEALKLALELHPDLILLDVLMPKMDGIASLQALRLNEWGKSAKVLFLTNDSGLDRVTQAVELAPKGYVIKADISLEKLVDKVTEILAD